MTLEGETAAPPAPRPAPEASTARAGHESVVDRVERTERSGGTHFPSLDAYRGIAMTMILVNHANYSTGFFNQDSAIARALSPVFARLDVAVPMFFVLSAFLLFRPFAMATLEDRSLGSIPRFWRRRALRILPAYWFALLGLALLVGLPVANAKGWIGNVLLLPAFGVPVQAVDASGQSHTGYAIGQAWSIGIELSFYLVLPLFAALVHRLARGRSRRGRITALLTSVGVVYLAGTAFRVYVVAARPSWAEQSLLWLPMFLDLFAIGLAFAVISAAVAKGMALPRSLGWLSDHPWVAWALALAVFLIVTRLPPPSHPFGFESADGSTDYLPRQFLFGLAAALWLVPAMFGDQGRTRLRSVLAMRFPVYLGAISLSFYLWHLGLIEKAKALTVPDWTERVAQASNPRPGSLDGLVTFTGSLPKVVVVAWLLTFVVASGCYYAVERPFLRLKDRPLRDLVRSRRLRSAST